MRITIQIDQLGEEAVAPPTVQLLAPPRRLEAAAELEAIDAGAAPAEGAAERARFAPLQPAGPGAPMAGPGDGDAGPAPDFASGEGREGSLSGG